MADRILSQSEIDNVFRNIRDHETEENASKKAQLYDFRRPERIAKDQIQSIHLVHENFARSVGSSLSAFLRSHIVANFISVEQLSFADFVRSLPTPSCLVALGAHPYEDNAILQLDRALVFIILEMLLGGGGKSTLKVERDITEIERGVLDSLFRIILQDLRFAWQSITTIDFFVQSHVSDSQLLQILAQDDAVVVVSMEVRVGENSGLMHLGFPSMLIKMFREKTIQQPASRRREATQEDHARVVKRIKSAKVDLEARLSGPSLRLERLVNLKVGDVLAFNYPLSKDIDLTLNGKNKFTGRIVTAGQKLGFQVNSMAD
ncbi:MAG TPA: flagellar motor switch protein FliM [Bryobacteraceae bacterium]|jgi:flagellar motor switch protein FliM